MISLLHIKGAVIGLLGTGRANEWIVTEKFGDSLKKKEASEAAENKTSTQSLLKKPQFHIRDRYVFISFHDKHVTYNTYNQLTFELIKLHTEKQKCYQTGHKFFKGLVLLYLQIYVFVSSPDL